MSKPYTAASDAVRKQKYKTGTGKSTDDSDPNQAGRMLKTEEIREICEKHQLTRMEVYNIRS